MIEIEVPSIDVEIVDEVVATSTGNVDIETVDLGDLAVTVAKKEYVITGDSIYVPVLYDDAPQWMKDLVGLAVEASMETANAESLAQLTQILSEFATGYVPLNQYTQSILDLSNADQSLQVFIETMNSNYNDGISEANSQIVDLQTTKASKAEVVTQVVDTIAAQLATPGSSLAAVVARLDQAIVDETSARSNSMEMLTAQIENVDSGVIANAEVLNTALAYVGIDEAGAETGSGLSAYLVDGSGNVGGATSKVANNVYVDALGNVKSKYEYNSTVSVNGSSYNSGFGLSNSSGTAIGSEFWINADKLKFTNSGKTGTKVPFSIDASGATPEIYFNGKVTFSNVTNVPQLGSTPQQVVDAVNNGQTTTINGSKITTGSIEASQIAAGSITSDKIDANAVSGKTISGGIITGTKLYGTQIEGAIIKASYIDLSSTATLTNWQQYTPATYPSYYDANFAKNNDGTLLVDSQGYVRLMGNTRIVVPLLSSTQAKNAPYEFGLYPYNSYKSNNINRCITKDITIGISKEQKFIFASALAVADETNSRFVKINAVINDVPFELYAHGGIYKSGADGWNFDYYIKENGIIVASDSGSSVAGTNRTITKYVGSMPVYINVEVIIYYGMRLGASIYTGPIPTVYSITNYSFENGSPIKVTSITYSSASLSTEYGASADVPAITVY